MEDQSFSECQAQELFDEFVSASTCRAALHSFSQLCEHLQLDPSTAERPLYRPIKRRLNYWRANGLWAKLDRRGAQEEYQRARACSDVTVRFKKTQQELRFKHTKTCYSVILLGTPYYFID